MTNVSAVRQALRDDFRFYAKSCVQIRTKDGDIRPFTLNGPQEKLHAAIETQIAKTGRVRIIILKARQQGFSTYVHARLYWKLSQRKGRKGLVVAHVAKSTQSLFDMYKRTHAQMPEAMKMQTKYSSRSEIVFKDLDTGLMVATAGGDGIVRGETINDAHLSEMAFWPPATAADNLNGLLQGVPNKPDTDVYIESTANGMSGVFYETWKEACAGTNGYIPFFSPWFDTPEYMEPLDGFPFEPTYEELEYASLYGVSPEQLLFRRRKIAESGFEKFQQEYPSNATEAFIASGRPVFNPDQIHGLLRSASDPIYRMDHQTPVFREFPRGLLDVWKERDDGGEYWIGADVGAGIRGRDYSVACVLDSQKNLVARWRGHIHPDYFAQVLFDLGIHYNTALVAVENNNHGILTAVRLGRDLSYPNVYTDTPAGKLVDMDTIRIGFSTTEKTKPLIIDSLRGAMRENEIWIKDEVTLGEMLSYVVNENGKLTAENGCFDDCVMSLAIANYVHDGKFTPITVSDDYYVNAL